MPALLISIFYTLFYAFSGIVISCSFFEDKSFSKKCWLGLVFGLFGMTWMPSLFSFASGHFSVLSHIFGVVLFFTLSLFCFIRRKKKMCFSPGFSKKDLSLLLLLPLFLIGLKLFDTHILQEKANGLYVGQTTYGDLAMHLGFISSLGTQGHFPPNYSIFPEHSLNYPFLCEISASSLYLFGADLRSSYLISALYAYLLVILGVFFLFQAWLKKNSRAVLATYLFFIGGGFGFAYFLNNQNSSSFVAPILNSAYQTNLGQLLNGYYTTPTNLPELGLRWVNPIVDMLVPQRATLFGWAFLFPCLTLLHEFMFRQKRNVLVPLALLASGLPLIHTHSFLSLGVISAVYCLYDLLSDFHKSRFKGWLLYAGIVFLLASPQLFGFTFQQVSESSMVKLHFNWANEKDSWFWFYLKNWGVLFLLLLPGMMLLTKRDRLIMSGPLVLWGISELMIFQPNTYDNNKLIFVFFAYLCGLCAKLLCVISHKLHYKYRELKNYREAYSGLMFALSLLILFFTFFPSLTSRSPVFMSYIKQGNVFTILFLGFLFVLISSIFSYKEIISENSVFCFALPLIGVALCAMLLIALFRQADSLNIQFSEKESLLIRLCEYATLLLSLLFLLRNRKTAADDSQALACAFYRIAGSIFLCTVFLSGGMTIAREWVSSYQIFNSDDLKAADFIKAETPADSVFLTSYSWHLNTVSVLTGRNIVCGPDLYLYYHGINTSERKKEVDLMFNDPETHLDLFEKYNVSYIYIGPDERSSYSIDIDYFDANCDKIYEAGGIKIYHLPTVK